MKSKYDNKIMTKQNIENNQEKYNFINDLVDNIFFSVITSYFCMICPYSLIFYIIIRDFIYEKTDITLTQRLMAGSGLFIIRSTFILYCFMNKPVSYFIYMEICSNILFIAIYQTTIGVFNFPCES